MAFRRSAVRSRLSPPQPRTHIANHYMSSCFTQLWMGGHLIHQLSPWKVYGTGRCPSPLLNLIWIYIRGTKSAPFFGPKRALWQVIQEYGKMGLKFVKNWSKIWVDNKELSIKRGSIKMLISRLSEIDQIYFYEKEFCREIGIRPYNISSWRVSEQFRLVVRLTSWYSPF